MIKSANPKKLQRTAQTVRNHLHTLSNSNTFYANIDDIDNSDLDCYGRTMVHYYEKRVGVPTLEQPHEVGRLRLPQDAHSHSFMC